MVLTKPRAFMSLIEAGYFAVVYGGAEVGSHLANHPKVDTLHVTGSDRIHNSVPRSPRAARPLFPEMLKQAACQMPFRRGRARFRAAARAPASAARRLG